jgi:hypothetical protein
VNNVVVAGCGELAWGRPSLSALGGRQWKRGRFFEAIHLGQEALLPGNTPGDDWIKPSDEIDRLDGWSPAAALGPPARFSLLPGQATAAPLVPAWREFPAAQARWVTRELGGTGILVTPGGWRASEKGRQALEAWAGEGWSWAALEEIVGQRIAGVGQPIAGASRFAAAAGLWLRLTQGRESTVLPNGTEAARALEITSSLIGFALGRLDGVVAARWRNEEEGASGWVVRQQAARRIMAALVAGQTRIELGTEAPLFHFSSDAARRRYAVLAAMSIAIEVRPVAVAWWERVTEPGFLHSRQGIPHPGIDWSQPSTIVLQGPEIRQLSNHLAAQGLPRELADPARLGEALEEQQAPPASPPPLRPEPAAPRPQEIKPAAVAAPARPRKAKAPPPDAAPERQEATVPPAAAEPAPTAPAPSPAAAPAPQASAAAPVPPASSAIPMPPAAAAAPEPPAEVPAAAAAQEGGETQDAAAASGAETEILEIDGVSTLPWYQPSRIDLDVAHHPERMRVWVDGKRIEPANIRRSRQGYLTLDGAAVPHSAIVRIDFDPIQK